MAEGSGTRSSLLWEVQRLLDECDGFSKYEENDTIEKALKDCKLFKEQAQKDWDKADGGIVLYHIDTIIKALSSLGD